MGKVYTRFQTKKAQKSNSKVDKVSPLFSIKTINKGYRVASQEMRCPSD